MPDALESPATRAARKEQTRQAILDAALDLADAESLATVSLRQVAKAVGIVPTAFYRHFASIDELGLALVDQSFASLREMLRDVRRNAYELQGVITGSVDVLVEHVHQRREHFRFVARERMSGPPVVRTRSGTSSSSSSGSWPPTSPGCRTRTPGPPTTCA